MLNFRNWKKAAYLLLAAALGMALPKATEAADAAKFRALGFSPDAQYFAFEQYGIQDGSGFAYDDIFIIDIPNDKWAKGSPIRTLLEDETGDVSAVRAKAKASASTLLTNLKIVKDAELLASNPFTELTADRTSIKFHDSYNNALGVFNDSQQENYWTLHLVPVKVPVRGECEQDFEAVGFRLELKNNATSATAKVYEDAEVPKSRFCALAYDIEAVVQPVGGDAKGRLVAIIGVSQRGFEGSDRRFLAVPFAFN